MTQRLEVGGHSYKMSLRGRHGSIEVHRADGGHEVIGVAAIGDDGEPVMAGRAPTLEDLTRLAELHGQYESIALHLYRVNELEPLGERLGYPGLSHRNTFIALKVLKLADETGVLAEVLERTGR